MGKRPPKRGLPNQEARLAGQAPQTGLLGQNPGMDGRQGQNRLEPLVDGPVRHGRKGRVPFTDDGIQIGLIHSPAARLVEDGMHVRHQTPPGPEQDDHFAHPVTQILDDLPADGLGQPGIVSCEHLDFIHEHIGIGHHCQGHVPTVGVQFVGPEAMHRIVTLRGHRVARVQRHQVACIVKNPVLTGHEHEAARLDGL